MSRDWQVRNRSELTAAVVLFKKGRYWQKKGSVCDSHVFCLNVATEPFPELEGMSQKGWSLSGGMSGSDPERTLVGFELGRNCGLLRNSV